MRCILLLDGCDDNSLARSFSSVSEGTIDVTKNGGALSLETGEMAYFQLGAAGATNNQTYTLSGAANNGGAQLALEPSSTAPATPTATGSAPATSSISIGSCMGNKYGLHGGICAGM